MNNNSINHKRKEAMLLKALSKIITEEVKNSNVSYPTVTAVKLSPNASYALVYVTFESNSEQSLDHLKRAKGFIRSRLTQLNLRLIPDLDFRIDTVLEKVNRINDILSKLKK